MAKQTTRETRATVPATLALVYHSLGEEPDTRIDVFGQEFLVHSHVLKLHSAFFRKFMRGKHAAAAEGFVFQYVSHVEDDGIWGVQPAHKSLPQNWDAFSQAQQDRAAKAFELLLHAMYLRRGVIQSLDQLEDVLVLADYYVALPVASNFIDSNLLESRGVTAAIEQNALRVLTLAVQARSRPLFREAFIHIVGAYRDWPAAAKAQLRDSVTRPVHDLVLIHYGKLRDKVANALLLVQSYLIRAHSDSSSSSSSSGGGSGGGSTLPSHQHQHQHQHLHAWFYQQRAQIVLGLRAQHYPPDGSNGIGEAAEGDSEGERMKKINEVAFFQSLYAALLHFAYDKSVSGSFGQSRRGVAAAALQRSLLAELVQVAALLKNNLVFASDGCHPTPGYRALNNYFLCTELQDDEFPWDIAVTEW